MDVEPYDAGNVEADWAAWEARCRVSHAGHFASARNEQVAFHRLVRPLSELRVALATSGGVHLASASPFDMTSRAGDDSVRWIPGDTPTSTLVFTHDHYDHSDADRDPNCMFPLDRLRELAAEGVIGRVAAHHVGFMGWLPDPTHFVQRTLPAVVDRLRAEGVDAVVISPG